MTARVAHVATVDLTHRYLLLAQLRALRDEGYDVTAISAPGPHVSELEAEGICFVPWPSATRAWDPRADARAFAELVRIFRGERFDLVHTHNPKPGVLGRVAARVAGVPCVMNTVHGLWATPDDRPAKRWPVLAAEWVAARCSDLELYQSGEDLRWARRRGLVREGRWLELGNGVDVERFRPGRRDEADVRAIRQAFGAGPDDVVVTEVGRMVAEKGYREFFHAAGVIGAQRTDVRFVAVGEPDPDKTDAIDVDELSAAGRDVVMAGWRDDVADVLAATDVFVLPSWREGMPRSAIEAAASGCAMVLTDIRGCREVARDGVEARLVPPRDARRLAGAITELVDDPDLRREFGGAARARAVEQFDERRVAATVVRETGRLLTQAGLRATAGTPSVRAARTNDVVSIAALHEVSMPSAFLPTLGRGFLRQLYLSLLNDPAAVVLVATRSDVVVGFVAAVPSVRAAYRRFLWGRGVRAGIASAPRLLRPSTLRRARETAGYPSTLTDLPEAELLSIAVEPGSRAQGVGFLLAESLTQAFADRGVAAYKVVVDEDNETANLFYERVGFRPAGSTAVHEGITSNVWVMSCRS